MTDSSGLPKRMMLIAALQGIVLLYLDNALLLLPRFSPGFLIELPGIDPVRLLPDE